MLLLRYTKIRADYTLAENNVDLHIEASSICLVMLGVVTEQQIVYTSQAFAASVLLLTGGVGQASVTV